MDEKPTEETTETYAVKPSRMCGAKDHTFVRTTGLVAQCRKCPVGFELPVAAEVADGHIFVNGIRAI